MPNLRRKIRYKALRRALYHIIPAVEVIMKCKKCGQHIPGHEIKAGEYLTYQPVRGGKPRYMCIRCQRRYYGHDQRAN